MRLSHIQPVVAASFDEPNLVSAPGLVPVMRLAVAADLDVLAGELLTVPTDKGSNAGGKVSALAAGVVAGADSIDDMALRRHGAMGKLFDQPYAVDVGVVPAGRTAAPLEPVIAFEQPVQQCG